MREKADEKCCKIEEKCNIIGDKKSCSCDEKQHEDSECECHCHCHGSHHDEHCHDGHDHDHDHDHDHGHGCGCGCGHDHDCDEERPLKYTLLKYIGGAIPVILAFIPLLPLWLRITAAVLGYALFGYEVWRGMILSFTKRKIFTEFTLMCVASVGAFAIGEFADAAAVVYLYSLGETLSDRAYSGSKRRIAELLEITPEYATVIRDGKALRVSPESVALGETVLVVTGERVPIDGVVLEGGADADTSSVTGESAPLALYEGVRCPSGAVVFGGSVKLKTTATYENSVVAKLSRAVADASKRKSSAEKKISRFARIFTPLAFALAALITAVGTLVTGDFYTWLRSGLVVLVVSCPCSLVLSVPLTYFAGMGAAASSGMIFRGGEVMDSMTKLRGVAFDKTGTLTRSELEFDGVELYRGVDEKEFLSMSYAALLHSPHAAAVSFCKSYKGTVLHRIENAENIGGRGIVCLLDGKRALFGNGALMRENGIDAPDSAITAIYGALDGALLGKLTFSSHPKEGAADAVSRLRELRIGRMAVISGDGEEAVAKACQNIGIDEFYYSVTPSEKADIFDRISKEEKEKKSDSNFAYCGDGLNDSAVIAMADVGIAMGSCGAALTVDSADLILMDDKIEKLCDAIVLSRRTSRIATQNIIISLGIKIAVLLVGVLMSALFSLKIPMELAIVADVGAALVAVTNALRASKRRKNEKINSK